MTFALFLVPSLCVGGLLEHACDCSEEEEDHQCQHEDSCESDPCSENLALPPHQDVLAALDFEWPWVPKVVLTWGIEENALGQWLGSVPPLPPDRSSLPYELSDRPLRI